MARAQHSVNTSRNGHLRGPPLFFLEVFDLISHSLQIREERGVLQIQISSYYWSKTQSFATFAWVQEALKDFKLVNKDGEKCLHFKTMGT